MIREVKSGAEEEIPVMLVGNKCDENENREVAQTEGEEQVGQSFSCRASAADRS